LNCALFVGFFDHFKIGLIDNRTVSSQAWLLANLESVRICSRFSGEGATFYGEFDSGSERTLAAWIRHASRAGLFL
jgi:hypothetical protein